MLSVLKRMRKENERICFIQERINDSYGYLASVEHVGLSHRLEARGPEPSSDVVRLEPVIKSWICCAVELCNGPFGTIVCGKIAV